MKTKFFICLLISFLILSRKSIYAAYGQGSGIPDDRRPKTKDYYSYCMSHRDYEIDVSVLDRLSFVSDLEPDEFSVEVRPSCNFSRRINENDIRGIVIHYTNGSAEGAYSWWQVRYPGTSAHYIIRRDGTVIQAVPEVYAAFHLGCYWNDEYCRKCPDELCGNNGFFYDPVENTIAVELENAGPVFEKDGWYADIFGCPLPEDARIYFYGGSDPLYHASSFYEAFTGKQLTTLEKLIRTLEDRYGQLMILGHSDIQQVSVDPGPAFPAERFFRQNFLRGQ